MRVAVEDENDHAPTFGSAHLSLEVPEGQEPQTLTMLRASDPDEGANGQLQYRILGENYPTPTNPTPTCPVLLLVGLCHTQWVWVSFPSFYVFHFFFHAYICISACLSASPAFHLPLCLCFYLLISFLFLFSPCGLVLLKLWFQNP